MKKILLAISSLFLIAGCSTYTVKVETDGVTINDEAVENGTCKKYQDNFFGFGGDFDLKIKIGEGEIVEKEAGHYVVSSDGISDVEEACTPPDEDETTDEEDSTEEDSTEEDEASKAESTGNLNEGGPANKDVTPSNPAP